MPLTQNNKTKKILVFGEILFDVYKDEKYLGGAPFNFAYHLYQLGYDSMLLSAIGNDSEGREIQDFFEKNGMKQDLIQINENRKTGKVMVHLNEAGIPEYDILYPVAWDEIYWNSKIENAITELDVFYFGSLCLRNKQARETLFKILEKLQTNALVFFDINIRQNFYSPEILEKSLFHSTILKCNEEELELISRLFGISGSEKLKLEKLAKSFQLSTIILTKGEKGSVQFDINGVIELQLKSEKENFIIDTVGAGDSFSAIFVHGLIQEWEPGMILKKASDFAEKICGIKGALPNSKKLYNEILMPQLKGGLYE